jgi:hypothetical protein
VAAARETLDLSVTPRDRAGLAWPGGAGFARRLVWRAAP